MALFRKRKKKPEDARSTDSRKYKETSRGKNARATGGAEAEIGRGTGKSGTSIRTRNKEFAVVTYLFLLIFLGWIVYFAWFMFFRAESVINNSYNARTETFAKQTVRGDILSNDGTVLATTQTDEEGNETRVYPYANEFAHAVGYTIQGSYGIEKISNFYMLRSHEFLPQRILKQLTGQKSDGDNVVTTLDVSLQEAAYNALGSHQGAVVALDPESGEILAMVSKPDFDPNTLADDWSSITSDSSQSVLLNRATQGSYPPGSIFKIFATVEYLREHNGSGDNYSFDCSGELTQDGSTIHCYHNTVHGQEDLESSFANSCNASFANIGLNLNLSNYIDLVNDSLFNTALPTNFEYKKSSFSLSESASSAEIMQTVIGQGQTTVSPYHMALLASAIANNGELITPYVVDHIENNTGSLVKSFHTESYGRIFSESECKVLQQYMEYTVENGTARGLSGQSYTAGGKTGTAEFSDSSDSAHAWFIGYAYQEGYGKIAIAVIVEDSGSGGTYAVPVAKSVFDAYFSE